MKLINYKVVQRGFLGVEINDLSTSSARSVGYSSMNGVIVVKVNDKSAADDAGIKQGDIIVTIDKMKVKNKAELLEQVGRKKPGDIVNIEYVRGGVRSTAMVTLKNKNYTTALLAPEKFDGNLDAFKKIGIADLRSLSPQESRKLGVKGIKVFSIEKGSRIDRTNMEIGFVITHINDKKIESIDQALKLIATMNGKVVLEGVYEDFPESYYYTFLK